MKTRQAPGAGASTAGGNPASFAETLVRAAAAPELRKAERTRLRLLAAIAERLASGVEPAGLWVSDVADDAGVAHGTFYRYFRDLPQALESVIADFARFQRAGLARVREGSPGSPARVRAATLAYVRLFRANAGLMRCLMDLGSETAAFRARYHALNRDWNGRVAAAIARRRAELSGAAPVVADAMLPTAYALDGMIDEFLTQLYLRRDPALAALAEDEAAVADLLSDLWCRGAYGEVPEALA
jgi:AcrR family transcriptional regulator